MQFGDVEFHNIEDATVIGGRPGVRLQRVPESVRTRLNPTAQERMLRPCGAEIRFVMGSGGARVTLASESATHVSVFHGCFHSDVRVTIGEAPQTLAITIPERLALLKAGLREDLPFSPQVVRLVLGGRGGDAPLSFVGIEGDGIRPPQPGEVPDLRYLAYGTSITQGSQVYSPQLTYVNQVARRLGLDALNLGSGGSAFCEAAVADYIAARQDWDLATLSISANMIGPAAATSEGFPLDEFYARALYMVNTIAGADLRRPVVAITIFPSYRDLGPAFSTGRDRSTAEEFRQALRDAVQVCPHPNVRLAEGPDLLVDLAGLSSDLIHPADRGMIQIGERLARRLAPLVKDCRDSLAARQSRVLRGAVRYGR